MQLSPRRRAYGSSLTALHTIGSVGMVGPSVNSATGQRPDRC